MASNHTEHYSLNQWEKSDKVLMEDFNADNAKIDAALAGKAEVSALAALAQTVSAHTAALPRLGNCRIWTTTYVGDGAQSRSLTFPAKPAVVFVMGDNIFMRLIYGAPKAMCSTSGQLGAACHAVWQGNTLTWSFGSATSYMCNQSGETHYVAALIAADT